MTLPSAHIAHQIPGRVRIRVPCMQGDREYFKRLKTQLSTVAGVNDATVNPQTGSLLLKHEYSASIDDIKSRARKEVLFDLVDQTSSPPPSIAEGLHLGIGSSLDKAIKRRTSGAANLRALLVFTLILLALRQALHGQILGPAVSLLVYAFEILERPTAS